MLSNYKKPPDYSVIKTSLKSIIHKDFPLDTLFSAVSRMHLLSSRVSLFLRSFILYKYQNNLPFPLITPLLIERVFSLLAIKTLSGRPPAADTLLKDKDLQDFYINEFFPLLPNNSQISSLHLSHVIKNFTSKKFVTNFEKSIKDHFFHYLFRFVNQSFLSILNFTDSSDKDYIKAIQPVKDALISNQLTNNSVFDLWIQKFKPFILPDLTLNSSKGFNGTYDDYLQISPQTFLPCILYMSDFLEKNNLKTFQFFPLITSSVPGYIDLDTSCLVEILFKQKKQFYMNNIRKYKSQIWNKLFKMSKSNFRRKGYSFDYAIQTDGIGVSIRFLHNSLVEKKEKKKDNMALSRNNTANIRKNLSKNEKEELTKVTREKRNEFIISNKQKENANKKKNEQDNKESFKALSDQEKNLLKEFPYVDKLYEKDYESLKDKIKVYIDPGKRSLLYMIGDKFQQKDKDTLKDRYDYTHKTRMHETMRLIYQKESLKRREKNGIFKIEDKLNKVSLKTCDYIKFKEYIKTKLEVQKDVQNEYENEYYRKMRWYTFINTQKSNAKLVNKIKTIYGNDPVLIIGDYSDNRKLKFISTSGIGLKRMLSEHFKIYLIDEFRTSKLHWKTEKETENLKVKDKTGESHRKHSILTYTQENKRMGCINRDLNSVLNMRKIVLSYLEGKGRPLAYRRSTKSDIIDSKPEPKLESENLIKVKEPSKIIPKIQIKIELRKDYGKNRDESKKVPTSALSNSLSSDTKESTRQLVLRTIQRK